MSEHPVTLTSSGHPHPSRPAYRFRTIVFDLDGTLADTAPDLAEAVNVMLVSLGRPLLDVEQVRSMLGDGVHVLVQRSLGATGGASESVSSHAYPLFAAHYGRHIADHSRPWPGAEKVLAALEADGTRLAICTNKLDYLTRRFLRAVGWESRFAAIVCGDTLPVRKPDRAPLLEAIRRAGGGPAIFVGDTIVDFETARAAGVPCALMCPGKGVPPPRGVGSCPIVRSYAELADFLATL